MAVSHLGLGSNVQSSNLMIINLLMIRSLSLGLPFGAGLNGHRPPETVGHLSPMQLKSSYTFHQHDQIRFIVSQVSSSELGIILKSEKYPRFPNIYSQIWDLTVGNITKGACICDVVCQFKKPVGQNSTLKTQKKNR